MVNRPITLVIRLTCVQAEILLRQLETQLKRYEDKDVYERGDI